MLINELPDDCLLTIFDYIYDLGDLIACFGVCEKWSNVIVGRTKRVKYLFNYQFYYLPDYVCNYAFRPVDVSCLSKLFPNLRIANLTFLQYDKPIKDIVKLFRDSESLKGIIYDTSLDFELMPEMGNLEMLSIGNINPNISGLYENVKQLRLCNSKLNVLECLAHHFPNLERLQFYKSEDLSEDYSDAPVLANLKILEMEWTVSKPSCPWSYTWCSFVFIDSCPALQSAHIKFTNCRVAFNDSIKNANLQDLVIQFYYTIDWINLRRLMSKYPNLKHLAIKGTYLRAEHIKQLLLILPKLTLLDIRESYDFTQEAANHVQDYCKQHGRSIKFYFKSSDKQIASDWPQTLNRPDEICRGFDFMEHCFFKSFDDLPHFLDPIDG